MWARPHFIRALSGSHAFPPACRVARGAVRWLTTTTIARFDKVTVVSCQSHDLPVEPNVLAAGLQECSAELKRTLASLNEEEKAIALPTLTAMTYLHPGYSGWDCTLQEQERMFQALESQVKKLDPTILKGFVGSAATNNASRGKPGPSVTLTCWVSRVEEAKRGDSPVPVLIHYRTDGSLPKLPDGVPLKELQQEYSPVVFGFGCLDFSSGAKFIRRVSDMFPRGLAAVSVLVSGPPRTNSPPPLFLRGRVVLDVSGMVCAAVYGKAKNAKAVAEFVRQVPGFCSAYDISASDEVLHELYVPSTCAVPAVPMTAQCKEIVCIPRHSPTKRRARGTSKPSTKQSFIDVTNRVLGLNPRYTRSSLLCLCCSYPLATWNDHLFKEEPASHQPSDYTGSQILQLTNGKKAKVLRFSQSGNNFVVMKKADVVRAKDETPLVNMFPGHIPRIARCPCCRFEVGFLHVPEEEAKMENIAAQPTRSASHQATPTDGGKRKRGKQPPKKTIITLRLSQVVSHTPFASVGLPPRNMEPEGADSLLYVPWNERGHHSLLDVPAPEPMEKYLRHGKPLPILHAVRPYCRGPIIPGTAQTIPFLQPSGLLLMKRLFAEGKTPVVGMISEEHPFYNTPSPTGVMLVVTRATYIKDLDGCYQVWLNLQGIARFQLKELDHVTDGVHYHKIQPYNDNPINRAQKISALETCRQTAGILQDNWTVSVLDKIVPDRLPSSRAMERLSFEMLKRCTVAQRAALSNFCTKLLASNSVPHRFSEVHAAAKRLWLRGQPTTHPRETQTDPV
ncbi:hypothetical protein DIPPA_18040 [Diplonema papillatum]|nr:hypothetical protein DIPPA_18040 [Diplonema papillatum]